MNKTTFFIVFSIFAASSEQMNAMRDRDGGGRDSFHGNNSNSDNSYYANRRNFAHQQLLKGLLENRYLSQSDKRDSLGFSNTGNAHLDACRNEPANGGLTSQQWTNIIEQHYYGSSYQAISQVSHRNDAWEAARTFEINNGAVHNDNAISKVATALLAEHDAQVSKLAQEVAPRIQAAMPAPTVIMQPAVTVAQTEAEKFKIALEMIQKSKELQELGAALAAKK